VDTNILLEVAVFPALRLCFSSHAIIT
jgi:hypothetical protein